MLASVGSSVNRHLAVGKLMPPLTNPIYPYGYRDLPLNLYCRTFCMSRGNGQYILFGSGANLFLSSNWGRTFAVKENAVSAGTASYHSLISDDGKVILLYGIPTGNSFRLSVDGLDTSLQTKTLGVSGSFTIRAMDMSNDGRYVYASGDGTSGNFYQSSDSGANFTISTMTSGSTFQSCACSPSGALVVLSFNNGTQKYSKNYGSTFTNANTTNYVGRKVFIHPDETFFAIRTTTSYLYVNLTTADTTKITDTNESFTLDTATTTAPIVANTPVNVDFSAAIDRNGRMYYVAQSGANVNKLCYADVENGLSTETVVLSTDSSLTFSGTRIFVTNDGKFLLAFNGTTLRLLKQFENTNAVSFQSTPLIGTTGILTFSWNSAAGSALPLSLYWTPRTSLSQPQSISTASTEVTISGGGFKYGKAYNFTLVSLTESGGLINGRQSSASTNNVDSFTLTGSVTVDSFDSSGTIKRRYIFTGNGTFVPAVNVSNARVLLVGGGGGGGGTKTTGAADGTGGGGAGELAYGSLSFSMNTTYTITVGAGGEGLISNASNTTNAQNGGNTSISTSSGLVARAFGGGAGGHGDLPSLATGQSGGSSGGACGYGGDRTSNTPSIAATPTGWTRHASKGGNAYLQKGGGGGGGAGAVGENGTSTTNVAGKGGAGKSITEFSSSTFAVGGDGGDKLQDATKAKDGVNAAPNTGNGGGGGSQAVAGTKSQGGKGGSGIVIILV